MKCYSKLALNLLFATVEVKFLTGLLLNLPPLCLFILII